MARALEPEQAALRRSHTPQAIRKRLGQRNRPSYISDFVYGAIDGAVTTFAVVAGVQGAGLDAGIIVILGTANLVGDGFSMAAGNFVGTRTERQQRERTRRDEERHVRLHPEGEREEVRQIFAAKGIRGEALDQVVDVITSDRQLWVETMLTEEHGLSREPREPWRAALMTFIAFFVIGAIPLLPFVPALLVSGAGPEQGQQFLWSTLMTGVAFLAVGALRSRFIDQRWWTAALETLGIGGAAAALAYVVGALLGVLAGTR